MGKERRDNKNNKLRKDVRNEERKQVKRRKDDTRDQTKTRKGTRKPTNKNQRTDSKNRRRHLMPGINTGEIREITYVRHLTAYHTPSPLPKFKLCKTSMQVAPANLSVYYVNNGSH